SYPYVGANRSAIPGIDSPAWTPGFPSTAGYQKPATANRCDSHNPPRLPKTAASGGPIGGRRMGGTGAAPALAGGTVAGAGGTVAGGCLCLFSLPSDRHHRIVPELQISVRLSAFRLPLKKALLAASRIGARGIEIDARNELRPAELTDT